MNGARNVKKIFGPHPWGPMEGPKDQISFNFNYKVISKIFIPNFVCVLTNERYKTYQTGFLFCHLGHALRVGLGGTGAKIKFGPAVCPLSCLLLNHWTKFNQIWCVSYSLEWGGQHKKNFGPIPWGPGEGSKGQISFNFNYKVNFQRFLFQTLIVFSQMKDKKTYRTGFLFCCLGHAPGVGLWGTWGAQGVNFFFQTWSCGISNRRGWQAEQNASNIFILGSNWWHWGEVKRSNIINMSISKMFIPNFVCVLTNKR